jgi:hypothetical protein
MGPLREVQVNFGEEDFKFDLKGFIKSRNEKRIQEINQVPIPSATVQEMIREYLLFNGYGNTLKLYEKAIHHTPPPETPPPLSSSSSMELTSDHKMTLGLADLCPQNLRENNLFPDQVLLPASPLLPPPPAS